MGSVAIFCAYGLPIPILPTLDPKHAQELIEQGWNSIEFKKLFTDDVRQSGISAGLALVINLIITSIYLFCLKSNDSFESRIVKIRKILCMSEVMVLSSNLLYVMLKKNLSRFDISGFSITLYTIMNSEDMIAKLKEEYIRENFESLVMLNSLEEED